MPISNDSSSAERAHTENKNTTQILKSVLKFQRDKTATRHHGLGHGGIPIIYSAKFLFGSADIVFTAKSMVTRQDHHGYMRSGMEVKP